MKVAYLHGLESTIKDNDPKIVWLRDKFTEAYTPDIKYRNDNTYSTIFNHIKKLKPDVIVGSSMGGYFAYQIGAQLKIKTVLFNPAVVGRSFEPKINDSNMKGTQNNVYLGKHDTVMPGKAVRKYFATEGVGTFTYRQYNGEHRVPAGVFIDAIADAAKINENNTMSNILTFDQFLNESNNVPDSVAAFAADEGKSSDVYLATFIGTSFKAQSTDKTWSDGVPVTKYFTRGGYKTISPKGKYYIIEGDTFWYFRIEGTWYAVKRSSYGTPPFEY